MASSSRCSCSGAWLPSASISTSTEYSRLSPQAKPGQIGGTQTTLAGPVHDMNAVGVGQGQFVGELAGAVGAAVVDDKMCTSGQGFVHPADDQRQVLPLVVGGDDDQSALTRAFVAQGRSCAPLRCRSCRFLYRLRRSPSATHETPIVQHCGDHGRDAEDDQQALNDRPPPRCGRELRFQPDRLSR